MYLIERWKNTLCMYNMDVGSNWRWPTPSTMTSWHHFHSTVTQNCQNLTKLQLCSKSVRVHLYAYLPHWKVLNHFLDVHYGCGNQSQVVYSLTRNIMHHFHLTVTQSYLNLFIHVQCGCEKQSKVVISHNNNIMASFPFDSHPELPKSDPASALLRFKGALICLRA